MTAVADLPHTWDAKPRLWDWPMQNDQGILEVLNTPTDFEVHFIIKLFTPKEINVQLMDKDLFVACHHEHRSKGGHDLSRSVNRAYHLPQDIDMSTVKYKINDEGTMLEVTGKKLQPK